MSKIWLSLAHMGGAEQRFVQSAFDSYWVAPLGPNVDGFEHDLEDWLSLKSAQSETHVVALSAGTAAVHKKRAGVLCDGGQKQNSSDQGGDGRRYYRGIPCGDGKAGHFF